MILLVLVIGFLVLSLWLTSIVAKALGAANASMFSIVAAGVVSGLILFPISFVIESTALLILLNVVITVLAFAKFLEINLIGAFLVYLANSAIWGACVVIVLVFGLGLDANWLNVLQSYDGVADIAAVESSAEAVCRCGEDEECLFDSYVQHVAIYDRFMQTSDDVAEITRAENYSLRADECFETPTSYRPRALVEVGNRAAAGQRPRPAANSNSYPSSSSGYSEGTASAGDSEVPPEHLRTSIRSRRTAEETAYREIKLHDIPLYTAYPIRLTRKDTQSFEGYVTLMNNGDTRVVQRRNGGEFGVVIPREQLLKAEVRKSWIAESAHPQPE